MAPSSGPGPPIGVTLARLEIALPTQRRFNRRLSRIDVRKRPAERRSCSECLELAPKKRICDRDRSLLPPKFLIHRPSAREKSDRAHSGTLVHPRAHPSTSPPVRCLWKRDVRTPRRRQLSPAEPPTLRIAGRRRARPCRTVDGGPAASRRNLEGASADGALGERRRRGALRFVHTRGAALRPVRPVGCCE